MINKRISYISFYKECFDKAATDYNKTFKNSCFNENINCTSQTRPRRKRNRNILWSNPPFSSKVKTNIDKISAHHQYLFLLVLFHQDLG